MLILLSIFRNYLKVMVSVERCKEILGKIAMSNSQVEKLREVLYSLVENVIDECVISCDKIKEL